MIRAAVLLMALAGPAAAETYAEAYGLGDGAPVPEQSYRLDTGITVKARLTDRKGVTLAALPKKDAVFVEVLARAEAGAGPEAVALTCSFEFADAWGETTELQAARPCYAGTVADLAGQWVPLGKPFRFFPGARDPRGTSGVNVGIYDGQGHGMTLTVTFDWQGGLF